MQTLVHDFVAALEDTRLNVERDFTESWERTIKAKRNVHSASDFTFMFHQPIRARLCWKKKPSENQAKIKRILEHEFVAALADTRLNVERDFTES